MWQNRTKFNKDEYCGMTPCTWKYTKAARKHTGPVDYKAATCEWTQTRCLPAVCEATLALKTGWEGRRHRRRETESNASETTWYHKQNRTHATQTLIEHPPPPAWAYLCSVKSNEADIKGGGGQSDADACFKVFLWRNEWQKPTRRKRGGRREERNAVGREQLVSIGMLRLALLLLREGFTVDFSFRT